MLKHVPVCSDPNAMHCSNCSLSHFCVPKGLSIEESTKLDQIIKERIRIPKGEFFFHQRDPSNAIYSIRSGSIKMQIENESGHIQITGFLFPGEFVGLDGIYDGLQRSSAIALEDTEVCVMTVDSIDQLAVSIPSLQNHMRQLLSGEIIRSQNLALSLGAMRSEQRVAAFLLDLSNRFASLGYSANQFVLRMSREEIGNFLGLTLETVSRLLSRFSKENLIKIHQREIHLLNKAGLSDLMRREPAR